MNFCRDWIFDVAVAKVSDEFLSSNLPLNTLAKKYAEGLSEKYAEISVQELADSAELLLLFLNEVDAGESAVDFLNGFQYFRYNFESVNKLRKLTPLFGAADDPAKTMTYSGEATAKRFKAYVFGLRSNSAPVAPAGWHLGVDNNLLHVADVARRTVSVLDGF